MATTKGGVMAARKSNQPEGVKSMQQLVLSMKGQIEKALPSVLTGERFSRMILTAMSSTPKLQECTPKSFLGAMMQAAQLGVEPNTPLGEAYLIPYKNHGILECQFQLGYHGMISLAKRNGISVNAYVVHENDDFSFWYGMDPDIKHKPVLVNRGGPIAYYAVWKDKEGSGGFFVMSIEDVKKHATKYSQSFKKGSGPWETNFDEMAKKTAIKQCLKYAPLTSEFARGLSADETIKSTISKDMVEVHDETEYTDVEATPVGDSGQDNDSNVDMETGEVLPADHSDQPQSEDDKILEASLNL